MELNDIISKYGFVNISPHIYEYKVYKRIPNNDINGNYASIQLKTEDEKVYVTVLLIKNHKRRILANNILIRSTQSLRGIIKSFINAIEQWQKTN